MEDHMIEALVRAIEKMTVDLPEGEPCPLLDTKELFETWAEQLRGESEKSRTVRDLSAAPRRKGDIRD